MTISLHDASPHDASPHDAARRVTDTQFRQLMSHFPTGVSVVTATDADGVPRGMTCSSVCSVSTAPPTLLVCLRAGSPTLAAALTRRRFAVNFLHADAAATATLFASGNPTRFELVRWHEPAHAAGAHLADDVLAVADCHVRQVETFGDHSALFAEVHHAEFTGAGVPLLYGLRRFSGWPDHADTATPA